MVPARRDVRLVEIARILGVSHQRASQLAARADFPAPVVSEPRKRRWDRREVEAWARRWRREKPWR
jgi:predicted DNA-binding transcriptional regulator AlpA